MYYDSLKNPAELPASTLKFQGGKFLRCIQYNFMNNFISVVLVQPERFQTASQRVHLGEVSESSPATLILFCNHLLIYIFILFYYFILMFECEFYAFFLFIIDAISQD